MSHDIYLVGEDGSVLESESRIQEGGTQQVGGTNDCELNITYNYSNHFRDCLDEVNGIGWLFGKTGSETELRLQQAVETLGTERDEDYWKSTKGNAGFALSILLRWAREYPNGVWSGI